VTAALVGAIAGAVAVALLYSYPKGETARRSYCVRCGTYTSRSFEHSVFGARGEGSTTSSMLTRVLSLPPGDHDHIWVEPWAHVFPTYNSPTSPELGTTQALAEGLLERRLRDLDVLDDHPHSIAVLDAAMKNDRIKARTFVERLLDPKRYYPTSSVMLLDRPDEWPERWAIVDAFDRAYRCSADNRFVKCTLTTRGKPKPVFEHNANGRGQASFPSFRDWVP
jgi:hypothetical protein